MCFSLFNRLMPFVKLNPKLLKPSSKTKIKNLNNTNHTNQLNGINKQNIQPQQSSQHQHQASSSSVYNPININIMRKDSTITFGGYGRGADGVNEDKEDAKSCVTNRSDDGASGWRHRIFLPKENSFFAKYFSKKRNQRRKQNSMSRSKDGMSKEKDIEPLSHQLTQNNKHDSSLSAGAISIYFHSCQQVSSLTSLYKDNNHHHHLSCNNMTPLIKNLYEINRNETLQKTTSFSSLKDIFTSDYENNNGDDDDDIEKSENGLRFFYTNSFRKTKSNLA